MIPRHHQHPTKYLYLKFYTITQGHHLVDYRHQFLGRLHHHPHQNNIVRMKSLRHNLGLAFQFLVCPHCHHYNRSLHHQMLRLHRIHN